MHAYLTQSNHQSPIPIPNFGAWIRYRRLELGLSCRETAELAGISLPQWRALEQGYVPFANEPLLRSIAGTLEIRYDTLAQVTASFEAHFLFPGFQMSLERM
jgi:transcriptional regulator with XRE-family HTH domain